MKLLAAFTLVTFSSALPVAFDVEPLGLPEVLKPYANVEDGADIFGPYVDNDKRRMVIQIADLPTEDKISIKDYFPGEAPKRPKAPVIEKLDTKILLPISINPEVISSSDLVAAKKNADVQPYLLLTLGSQNFQANIQNDFSDKNIKVLDAGMLRTGLNSQNSYFRDDPVSAPDDFNYDINMREAIQNFGSSETATNLFPILRTDNDFNKPKNTQVDGGREEHSDRFNSSYKNVKVVRVSDEDLDESVKIIKVAKQIAINVNKEYKPVKRVADTNNGSTIVNVIDGGKEFSVQLEEKPVKPVNDTQVYQVNVSNQPNIITIIDVPTEIPSNNNEYADVKLVNAEEFIIKSEGKNFELVNLAKESTVNKNDLETIKIEESGKVKNVGNNDPVVKEYSITVNSDPVGDFVEVPIETFDIKSDGTIVHKPNDNKLPKIT